MKKAFAITALLLFSVFANAVHAAEPENVKTIFRAFDENEVGAKKKYGKGDVIMTGYIDKIEESFLGYPEISFDISGGLEMVKCQFEKKDADTLGNLKKGQMVTISGQFERFGLGTILSFEKCKFIR